MFALAMSHSASSDYEPIACGFYDELGLRMLRGSSCTLVLDVDDGTVQVVDLTIENIGTEGNEEFAYLSDGSRVRLDRIRRVDNVVRSDAC